MSDRPDLCTLEDGSRAVVITRPLAQAETLAQGVAALGHRAELFPLLDILPLADVAPLRAALVSLVDYAMVAFVSPNAIDAAFAHMPNLPHWPSAVTLAVMGEGSRAALARHGVTDANACIVSPANRERTDSETLLETLDLAALRGAKVLIIRGETGREFLAERLRGHGVTVTQVAAYRRVAPALTDVRRRQLSTLLERKNDWLVTNSEALLILANMVKQVDAALGVAKMQQQRLIVPHVRIAETARALGFLDVTLTGSGDERLLAALQFKL